MDTYAHSSVSALDVLLMAGDSKPFKKRLRNVLGEKAFVLPKVDFLGQPRCLVGEIAEDLYILRSAIAHGQVIPSRFLAACDFLDVNGIAITAYPRNSRYFDIMQEFALFTLTSVLRKIFVEGRVKDVNDTTMWRARLEHPF